MKLPRSSVSLQPSEQEVAARARLRTLFESSPVPPDALLDNLELYMRPQRLAEVVTLNELYKRILGVHGVVMEFGVRWGRHLSVFSALRALHEPHNFYRRIVGFDTFAGFTGVGAEDGTSERVHDGAMAVSDGYERHLEAVLEAHEAEAPMSHIRRFELRAGDAPEQLQRYLEDHPETIVALAYFDMDIYAPTKACLDLVLPHMTRGCVLAFDEVLHHEFPGETQALKEALDLRAHALERLPGSPYPSFVVL